MGTHSITLDTNLHVKVQPTFKGYSPAGDIRNPCFNAFLKLVKEAQVFFDVGAHAGLYTMPAGMLMEGTVHAFEPSPIARAFLASHLELNSIDNCIICPYSVSDRCGLATLFQGAPQKCALSGFLPPKKAEPYTAIPVNSITLDRYCEESGALPDLLKIDVEGAEMLVLEGAEQMLRKKHPTLILSVHPEMLEQLGSSAFALFGFLKELGYQVSDSRGARVASFSTGEYICRSAGGRKTVTAL